MELYFNYYFYERAEQMVYPLEAWQAGRPDDNLLNLLSENKMNIGKNAPLQLRQSFMTAGNAFKAIDAPTHAAIVPHKQGEQLITELCALSKTFNAASYYTCLKKAQMFSVNVFPQVWRKLVEQQAVHEIHAGEGVFYLDKQYYSEAFGLSTEIVDKAAAIIL
jgi:CRISPR-associated endonuclease/helicase Cas3